MEVLTLSWSNTATVLQNYLDYPRVFLALVDMMHEQKINPEVYELLLQMFKSIISKLANQIMFLCLVKSIQGIEDKKDLAFLYKRGQNIIDDDVQMAET